MRVSKMYTQTMLPDEQVQLLGEAFIALFHLKVDKSGTVETAYGKKTPLGIGHTILNLVEAQYINANV